MTIYIINSEWLLVLGKTLRTYGNAEEDMNGFIFLFNFQGLSF